MNESSVWSLVTYRLAGVDADHLGALRDDESVVALPVFGEAPGLMAVMDQWSDLVEVLKDWIPARGQPIPGCAGTRLPALISNSLVSIGLVLTPSTVLCLRPI